MDIAKELLAKLDQEEAEVLKELNDDIYGLLLLTVIKESDHYHYHSVRNNNTEEQEELWYLMFLGLPLFIKNALEAVPAYALPTVTFKSQDPILHQALSKLARLGMTQHGRRLCYGSMAKECNVIKLSDTTFRFILPKNMLDNEGHEARIRDHYYKNIRITLDKKIDDQIAKNGLAEEMDKLLFENVFLFNKSFIGYEAHPVLDAGFFFAAYRTLEGDPSFETFSTDTTFGGVKIQQYFICLCYLVSLSLKHERFCETLVQKHPEVRMRDILTITCEKEPFIEGIFEAVNFFGKNVYPEFELISADQANIMYKVFSLRRDNIKLSDSSNFPILVEYSDTSIIRTVNGATFRPGEFFLESLKFNFPEEYDRNQNKRESYLQHAIETALINFSESIISKKNIMLKKQGQAFTDLDLVAIDGKNGEIFLIQLKHQDEYAADMKKRFNRGNRLKKETEFWLQKVKNWMELSTEQEIKDALQLKSNFKINKMFFVLIAKNYAHFLAPLANDEDFVYGTWMQFLDAVNRTRFENIPNTLQQLFETMRKYMTHKVASSISGHESDEYKLEGVTYQVCHSDETS